MNPLALIVSLLFPIGEGGGAIASKLSDIVVSPSSRSSLIGSHVTFACHVGSSNASLPSSHPFHRPIRWLGPDLDVIRSTSGRIHVERINGSYVILHVTDVRWSDQGRYRCTRRSRKVRRSQGGHRDDYVDAESRLSVLDTTIEGSFQSIRVPLGDDVMLPCSGSENTRVAEWSFKSKQIFTDERHSLTSEGLEIKEASPEDEGTYECRDGWRTNRLRLQVLVPPVIEHLKIPDKVIRGQIINITCEVQGNHPVQFQWAKEQKVSDMVRVKKKLQVKDEHLELHDVTVDDEGRYFCLVSNDGGTDEKSVDLRVLSPPTIKGNMQGDRLTVLANSSLVVACVVDGVPSPKIEWLMSTLYGRMMRSYEEFRVNGIELKKDMMIINSTNKMMTGNVTCLATNEAGSSSRTSTIIVEHEPSSSLSPPLQYGWMEETRKFKCTSVSFPLSTLSWFHNDLYLEASNHHHHHHHHHHHQHHYHHQVINHVTVNTIESILTISIRGKSTLTYGNYTCLAKNKHGHSTNTGLLIQGLVPDPPRNISILDENPNEVVITGGTQDSPLPPISWSVSYEEYRQGSKQHREIFSFGERILLRNLKPSTEYTVYLALRNAVGYSQPTKFKLHTPPKNSSWKNTSKHFTNEKMQVSDASTSNLESKNQDYESKFSSMKKTKKKPNLDNNSNHIIWAMATGLILTVASSITTACVCTAWRQRHRKCQNNSDILSLRGQINSPIPPNSILLVPVSNNDQNGQPVLTNDDVETLVSELASLSQDTPSKTPALDQQFGTFPRHFKQSKEDKLNCFSPAFSPATSSKRKAGELTDIFGAQFRKIQPEINGSPICNGHTMKTNFMPIVFDRTIEDMKHSKRFIPIAESTLRKNYTNESFSTCGGYKSADNVDDDIDSVGCNTPGHHQFMSNRNFHDGTCAYVRSMSQLK